MDEQRSTVRTGYDGMADEYDADRTGDPADNEGLVDLRESLPADPRLLDLGCGAGEGPLQFLPAERAVGLDFSGEQLRLARERVDADLVSGEMTALPFAADSFDAVTAFYSVIHLPIADHADCYAEVERVLRRDGEFLFSIGDDWAGENDDWLDSGEGMAWSFPAIEETERLLEAAGLTVVERYGVRSELDDGEWPFLRCRVEE
ncbi:class I SAM-dependent methyltransferase [Halolamina sp. CBA1230]|uniref:class I SAM-dependent methyltransferase n=1 Tax=Halolamina sp. CBA1230 TaxID=1853690 RepID=UPI0009A16BC3|nr:class I SAM-dependent methyltransferase [Halolamina sp. CBA1230]QKY19096.1 class I SAM-dependent methyltransferase [Halolamina sp. CBA1230]